MKFRALIFIFCVFSLSFLFALAQAGNEPSAPAGAPHPTWNNLGLEINNTPGNTPQQIPRIAQAAGGGFLVVWEDGRYGYSRVFAQKIDSQGNKLWNAAGVGACDTNGNQNNPRLIDDGRGGAIIVWQGYSNGNSDIFAQHISSRGELLWGESAIVICSAEAGQFAPELVSDGFGGAIIVWHDYRGGAGEDIYAQRVAQNGALVWKENGLPICAANGTQWHPKIAGDGMGGAVITWADGRASSADNNIYGQRVDASGKILWEKDGLSVCSAAQNQEQPVIMAVDKGAAIAWNDSRNGNVDIYCQKINLEGAPLWEKDGVAAAAASFGQTGPKLAPDGLGGVVVAWTDAREEETAIFAQRIMSDGKINWEENGRLIAKSPGKQENPEILKCSTLDWVILWEDHRKGFPLLFAQKINSAGIILWQEGGIPLALTARPQEKASAVLAPDGNIAVAWQDSRGGNFDIFAQAFSFEGAPVWEKGGTLVCNTQGSVVHQNAGMIESGRGEMIIAFEDARSGFLNIYVQKISRDGVLLWGKNAVPVAKVKADQAGPQLVSDGAGGAIICWEDQRTPDLPKIFAQRISSSGKKIWNEGSLSIAKIDSRQTRPQIIADGNGGAIMIWEDERDPLSLKDIYGQKVSGQGELLWGKNGIAICGDNGDQTETAIISDNSGGAYIAWTDYRRGERNPDIYTQRVEAAGKLVWQKDGIPVCGAPDVQRTPQLTVNREGNVVVAWTDKGGGSYDIYAQSLNPEGKTFWLTDGIPINQSARTQQNPKLDKNLILVWEDYRYGNWDLFAGIVMPQGKLAWGEEGVPVISLPLTQYAPQIAAWKNEGTIITWEDYRNGKQYEIFFQKLNLQGKPVWQENGVAVKTSNGSRAPKILAMPDDDSFVIVWEDYTHGGKALFGQRFTAD